MLLSDSSRCWPLSPTAGPTGPLLLVLSLFSSNPRQAGSLSILVWVVSPEATWKGQEEKEGALAHPATVILSFQGMGSRTAS